jgi:predicted lipoprotein with Yx(FWY)xxD motif
MRYRHWAPALLALPALALAACAGSTTPGTASGASQAARTKSAMTAMPAASQGSGMAPSGTVSLMKVKTAIGPVLANAKGLTLYWYAKDTAMTSNCTGGCATVWSPVTGKPVVAMGIRLKGKLGTIDRMGGGVQATYKGHPLYTYADDMAPGQAKGNGASGLWHAARVSRAGAVRPRQVMMPSSPSPSASSSSGGYGGGYGGGGY